MTDIIPQDTLLYCTLHWETVRRHLAGNHAYTNLTTPIQQDHAHIKMATVSLSAIVFIYFFLCVTNGEINEVCYIFIISNRTSSR